MTKNEIRAELIAAKKSGCTHVIIVCDTYDYEDYSVCVKRGQNVHEVAKEYNGKNMQRIMEVYSMNRDIEEQLKEVRSFHYE